jgi:hypothetical protein
MPKPLSLSDSELDAVMAAARPLEARMRDAFLQRVASELGRCGAIGPGVVHRICATAQAEFFDPPDLPNVPTRWGSARPAFERVSKRVR